MYKKLESGIRIIFGPFGCGKGTLNAILAIIQMRNRRRYLQAIQEILKLQDEFNKKYSLPPQEHVVHTNFSLKYRNFEAYSFNEDKFMLPNDKYEYELLEPCAYVAIEEGQSGILDAYDWQNCPKPLRTALARPRHIKVLMAIDSQSVENINKKARTYAFEYLRPLHIDNTYNRLNCLIKTEVITAVFYKYEKAVEFEKTEDLNLVDEFRVYSHKGNIYKCFDSEGKRKEFYENSGDKDFCYGTSIKVDDVKTKTKVEVQSA